MANVPVMFQKNIRKCALKRVRWMPVPFASPENLFIQTVSSRKLDRGGERYQQEHP